MTPKQSVETDNYTTAYEQWETMEFDFSNESEGTAILNTDFVFDMASLFFDFGSTGNQNIVYYFDNLSFGSPLNINDHFLTYYRVFPNPFVDKINIIGIEGDEIIILNDILGKEVFKGIGVEKINLSNYQKGTYLLTVTKNTLSRSFKILKK